MFYRKCLNNVFFYLGLSDCFRAENLNPDNNSFSEVNPVKTLSKLRYTKLYGTPIGLTKFDRVAIGKSFLESA